MNWLINVFGFIEFTHSSQLCCFLIAFCTRIATLQTCTHTCHSYLIRLSLIILFHFQKCCYRFVSLFRRPNYGTLVTEPDPAKVQKFRPPFFKKSTAVFDVEPQQFCSASSLTKVTVTVTTTTYRIPAFSECLELHRILLSV